MSVNKLRVALVTYPLEPPILFEKIKEFFDVSSLTPLSRRPPLTVSSRRSCTS